VLGQSILESRRRADAPGLRPTGGLVVVVGRVQDSAVPVGDALQAARDVTEESLALGKTPPLATVRQGEVVLLTSGAATGQALSRLRMARRRGAEEHGVDVRYGVSATPAGFPGVPRAYREASLAVSYTSAARPVVALEELSALECVLLGMDATTRELLATKGEALSALGAAELAVLEATVRAFAAADLHVSAAALLLHVHPNTVRQRLARIADVTGHDPRTHAGLTDLVVLLDVLRAGEEP
jgi:purine catabolism regulator